MTPLSSAGQNTSQDLLHHINNQDPHIQFTVEPTQQGSLPFLDTLVTIEPDNTFSTTVYRKPTHTDQFLHWDSNHQYHCQTKCLQHPSTQGQNSILHTRQNGQGTPAHQDSITTLSVSRLGLQLMATQIYQSQPTHHHQQQQYPSQQQKEHHHFSSIHAQHGEKSSGNCAKRKAYKYTSKALTH